MIFLGDIRAVEKPLWGGLPPKKPPHRLSPTPPKERKLKCEMMGFGWKNLFHTGGLMNRESALPHLPYKSSRTEPQVRYDWTLQDNMRAFWLKNGKPPGFVEFKP